MPHEDVRDSIAGEQPSQQRGHGSALPMEANADS
jgi:hypothetical protein